MKIGILTFHCAHNYGAVLQAYAIQEQLKLMGFDVEIINYRPIYLLRPYGYLPQFHFRTIKDGYLRCLILNVKILLRWIGTLIPTYRRRKGFNKFIQSKLSLSFCRYNSPFVEHNEYDFYIMGSDQVWNPKITKKFDDVYFGNFKVRVGVKKISYAVSMPLYTFSSQQKEQLNVNLRNFSAISVRETQLEEFIFDNFKIKSQVVLDPTLLVDNFVWRKIAIIPNINKKYVLESIYYKEPCSTNIQILSIILSSPSGSQSVLREAPNIFPKNCQKLALKLPKNALISSYEDWLHSRLISLMSILPCDRVNFFNTGLYC